MEQKYISGMGKDSIVPEEVKGWNWGAFCLNWIWGIGNSTYIALLMFVPLVNFVMLFVLGAKGSEWAWRNRTWRDVEHFQSTQKKWRNAGILVFLVVLPLLFIMISHLMKGEAYHLSLDAVQSDSQVIAMVGENLQPGFFVLGQVAHHGDGNGSASLNYSIAGDRSSAEVYVAAAKITGLWQLRELVVVDKETHERVVVVTQAK
ncbi:MAG: cytochrome c oxidase assembly factor Coa1 family protein [Arenicella sp.]